MFVITIFIWAIIPLDNCTKDKYIREYYMKAITKPEYAMLFLMLTPVITTLAYATYKIALEVWCIAYGLIY